MLLFYHKAKTSTSLAFLRMLYFKYLIFMFNHNQSHKVFTMYDYLSLYISEEKKKSIVLPCMIICPYPSLRKKMYRLHLYLMPMLMKK